MEIIVNYLLLAFFIGLALLCLYQLRKKKLPESYGEEHRPFVPKGLYKYNAPAENNVTPMIKDTGFPPKEYGATKGTKQHKQRKAWKLF